MAPVFGDLACELDETAVGQVLRDVEKHIAGGKGEIVQDLFDQVFLALVIKLSKMRGDAGFERELTQDGRAVGMDGLNFEAAGRFECAGEKSAGLWQRRGRVGFYNSNYNNYYNSNYNNHYNSNYDYP